ncbi:MAG: GNAT family N-acetyltransferase [Oscillospiraceae bacterium]|nr:GNAT family N-acetyltransferase [Oscillospiraceae bacterium]
MEQYIDNKFVFKRLELGDKETVKELFLAVFTVSPWYDDWSDSTQLDCYITDLMGQSNSLTYGLFENENLIAVSMGRIKHWYTGTEYCIDEFCVRKEMQGKGVGTFFLGNIEKAIREIGLVQIYLQTDIDVKAFDFYIKNGFVHLQDTVSLAKQV